MHKSETKRLAEVLYRPRAWIQRRHVTVSFLSKRIYEARTTIQLEWKIFDEEDTEAVAPRYVPLGLFSRRRVPDLTAHSDSGSELPILSRIERGRLLARLIWQRHGKHILDRSAQALSERLTSSGHGVTGDELSAIMAPPAKLVEEAMLLLIGDFVVSTESEVTEQLERIYTDLGTAQARIEGDIAAKDSHDPDLEALLAIVRTTITYEPLRTHLTALTKSTYLVAVCEARLDRPVMYSMIQSDRIGYEWRMGKTIDAQAINPETGPPGWLLRKLRERGEWAESLERRVRGALSYILGYLALAPVAIVKKTQDSDHSESFHLSVEVPPGTEVTQLYWAECAGFPTHHERSTRDVSSGASTLMHYNGGDNEVQPRSAAIIELQVARMGASLVAGFLVAGVWCVCGYVYAHYQALSGSGSTILPDDSPVLSLLVTVPGIIAGVYAGRSHEFEAYIVRGLRHLTFIVAGLSTVVGASIALQLDAHAQRLALAGTSTFALGAAAVLFYASLAPRWIRTDPFWLPNHKLTPVGRRYARRQLGAIALLLILAGVVAYCLALT